jgi:hypothetical protein
LSISCLLINGKFILNSNDLIISLAGSFVLPIAYKLSQRGLLDPFIIEKNIKKFSKEFLRWIAIYAVIPIFVAYILIDIVLRDYLKIGDISLYLKIIVISSYGSFVDCYMKFVKKHNLSF